MEDHINDVIPITIVIALFLLGAGVVLRARRRRRLPYPPGPRGLPLVGSMSMMDQLTHRGLARLGEKYGGLVHMRMGSVHVVAVTSPEMARQVLQVHDNVFSNRPATIAIRYLTYDRADMVFAHYGSFWRQMRKLCVVRLFSRRRAESWQAVRDEVDRAVRFVAASASTPVNVGELVFKLTMDITYRAAFGLSAREGQDEFIRILEEFSRLFGAFNVADFVPWLTWLDPNGLNPRLAKARSELDGFIDKIIDEHMRKREMRPVAVATTAGLHDGAAAEADMVDDLLAFYGDGEAKVNESSDDLQSAIRLTRDNIKAIIMDIMFGGTETVASVIEWAMSELMRSPEDLKRVQKELVDVVGLDRRIEEADFEKLTYLKCTLKETLRLHPPVPLLFHETAEDVEVAGYHVAKKTRVMINVWAICRDKNSWADPDEFRPNRFLEDGAPDFKGSNFEFIPFGSGRRSCPGIQLGLYTLQLAVGHLLHCFTWELPGGIKPTELDMSDEFGLTTPRTTRLVAVPTKRVVCPI